MSLKNLVAAVSVVISLLGVAGAQQSPTPSRATGIALEVTFFPAEPPTYQPVPWAGATRGWVWYARFGKVAGWTLPAGAQPVRAVKVVPFLDEEAVRITVSVLRGKKFHDTEETAATYSARENETITIAELKEFGVEPFQIKVVRVAPQTPALPRIVNHTKSIEVVGVEPVDSTFPVYKLTFRSLSDKNISAVQVNVAEGGGLKMSGMPQGKDGQPLIKAGASFELKQPLDTHAQPTAAGFAPASPPTQSIVIASLVFEDGTYEGEALPAARYRGYSAGRKTELERIVPVLESALAHDASAESLRTDLSALSFDWDPNDLALLAADFPGIKREQLQISIEASIHGVRRELLADMERFEQRGIRKESFRNWLTRTRDRYSNWLERMGPQAVSQR
jgi:hypothetical protein